jgi:hypothetical protein
MSTLNYSQKIIQSIFNPLLVEKNGTYLTERKKPKVKNIERDINAASAHLFIKIT